MVERNGLYYMKTVQETELEKRVRERKQELLESFRAQKEERREMEERWITEVRIANTEKYSSIDRGDEFSAAMGKRRRQERNVVDNRTGGCQAPDGPHFSPAPEQQSYSKAQDESQFRRTPSFRLNAGK